MSPQSYLLSWRTLRLWESPIFAKSMLDATNSGFGFTAPKTQTFEAAFAISAAMSQARSYFTAATQVDLEAKPLLLYYGMLHFAKIAAILANPWYGDTLEAHKHGLSARRRKGARYDYWKDRVFVQKNGVFLDWFAAAVSLSKAWPAIGPAVFGESIEQLAHVSLSIAELWRCIPEAAPLLDLLGRSSRCTKATVANDAAGVGVSIARQWTRETGLTSRETEQYLLSLHPQDNHTRYYTVDDTDWIHCLLQSPHPTQEAHLIQASFQQHGWACLPRPQEIEQTPVAACGSMKSSIFLCVPPLPIALLGQFTLPEPFIYFLLLFHLSMLQRYDAAEWINLTNDSMGIEHILIERLCQNVLILIPSYVSSWSPAITIPHDSRERR